MRIREKKVLFELEGQNTYKITCVPSQDTDQPAQPHTVVSLLFARTSFLLIFANSTTREFKIHVKYLDI